MPIIARVKVTKAPTTHASSALEGRSVCGIRGIAPARLDDAFFTCRRCARIVATIIGDSCSR